MIFNSNSWPNQTEPSATLTRLRGHFAALASGDYLFDGNGNVTRRTGQVLSWDAENHLAQINFSSDTRSEWYTYDERGVRVSKTEGTPAGQVNATTWYLFPHYERKQTGTSAAVATKYYYFDNMLIAKRTGSTLTYLHTDLLGSVLLETNSAGAVVNDQRYYAYGRRFDTGGSISGERDFTGQNKDATDLLYYNARYYDPRLGQFLSPDTLVPDPSSFLSYNRYLYALGNPLKYNDPTGHAPCPACPTIIIINGINQTRGVPATNSVDLKQNLAEWGHSNTYQSDLIYTSGDMAFDAFTVGVQHVSNQGPWGFDLGWTTGNAIRRMEADIDAGRLVLNPAQGAIIIGHSGGGPVAIGVAEYMEAKLSIPVKALVTIGSPLFDSQDASLIADSTLMISYINDPLGMAGIIMETSDQNFIAAALFNNIRIAPLLPPFPGDLSRAHNEYGSSDEVIRTMRYFIPELSHLTQPTRMSVMQQVPN